MAMDNENMNGQIDNTPNGATPENMDVITQSGEENNKYVYRYPHPAVTTDCCIFTFHEGVLKILLVERGIEPFKGKWALPGGFVRIDETCEQCALRELFEETGYASERVTQFHTYSEVGRDPRERIITVAYYALVKWERVEGGDDASDARWFDIDKIPKLAFDHIKIVHDALRTMKRSIYFEPLGYELLPSEFSMSELQHVYESIMKTKFDRRNFYNKMRNTGMVVEVNIDEDYNSGKRPLGLNNSFKNSAPQSSMKPDNLSAPFDGLCCMSVADSFNMAPPEDFLCYSTASSPDDILDFSCMEESNADNNDDLESPSAFVDKIESKRALRPTRRRNVKYRFNIGKFLDKFNDTDEPFTI